MDNNQSRKIVFGLADIEAAAKQFLEAMAGRSVFALYGSMGAGKTTFVRAVCRELGVTEDVVASPTFAIVNEYQGETSPVYHFDFYRVKSLQEAVDMGVDDYLYSGYPCFIEWPQLVEQLLPDDAVNVTISELPDGLRQISW